MQLHLLEFVTCANNRGTNNQNQKTLKLKDSILYFLPLFINESMEHSLKT